MTMTLSEELRWRGFVNQTTLSDLAVLDTKKWTFYHGYDASADSQTVGNLAAMMLDRLFMKHGHKAIILAGGATSLIGDPGGKDSERPLQDEEIVTHNVSKAEEQLRRILSGYDFKMVNNLDWTKDLKVIDFLRDIGKHFSMTPLVQRDYIAKRIGEGGGGISYTEFSYTLLQGYDFLHLHQQFGVDLQLAGSDQWGNGLSGVELVRRISGDEVHVFTLPLIINKVTGKKFGKSEEGAIWLDSAKTSAYKFYQFWLNVDDESAEDYLKIFTELDKESLDKVMQEFQADKGNRMAQKTLAYEVTKIVHGQQRAESVKRVTEVLFGSRNYEELTTEDYEALSQEIPTLQVDPGTELVNILTQTGLAGSNSEAHRFLQEKAVYLNGKQIDETKQSIQGEDYLNGHIVLRRGKNTQALLKR